MKAKDTVKIAGDLCRMVCLEHRENTGEGKNCDGLDCEECQLLKQAEISFKAGQGEAIIEHGDHLVAEGKQAGIKEALDLVVDCEVLCTESNAQSCGCTACQQFWIKAKEWKL